VARDGRREEAAAPLRRELRGWITVPREGEQRPLVRFCSELEPGVFASRIDVRVGVTTTDVSVHDPPAALSEDENALVRARALAIASRTRQCTDRLNSVVLRDASGEIHVYLLAATTRSNEVVLAGHDLARISADGRALLEWRSLSRTCLVNELPKAREGELHGVWSRHGDRRLEGGGG
jgi:hypothetical protein